MKNSYENTMTQSDFWNYIVSNANKVLDDMDNFQYSDKKFINKIKSIDNRFWAFILGMKFVAYEEEIVDEKKKNDAIEETLGLDIIEKFVYNKDNNSLDPSTALTIFGPDNVLKDNEHDARWVLGVIKKCIAHGNFSLDFDRGVFIIDNDDPMNELNCEVGCIWLARLGDYITPDRNMTINHTDLLLKPYIASYLEKPIRNVDDLNKYLRSDNFECYFPLMSLRGGHDEKLKAKSELLDFWNKTIIDSALNGSQILREAMPSMTKTVDNGQILLASLGEQHFSRIISEVNNVRDFYRMSPQSQQGIIETIMHDIGCIELFPYNSHNIDFGLELLGNQVGLSKLHGYVEECIRNKQQVRPNDLRVFSDYSYNYGAYKKKMALAYTLGVLLFSGHKDEIFDEEIDYDDFDLSNIVAYDFVTGKELEVFVNNLKDNISSIEDYSMNKKTRKVLDKKKQRLKNFEEQLLRDTNGNPATRPSNKEIFHRIRNAFSHKQIYNSYVMADDENVTTSIDMDNIILSDEDKFAAYVNIDDLLELLMDRRFYEALKRVESKGISK